MASLSNDGDGTRRVLFMLDGKRKSLRLGTISARDAQYVVNHVEALLRARRNGTPIPAPTEEWLGTLDPKRHGRLAKLGVVEARGPGVTLGDFLTRYFETMTTKGSTRTFYGHTRRNLLDYFKADRALASIGPADIDAWRAWLVEHEGLSRATVARRTVAARTFWRRAVRWKMATENPFDGIKAGCSENADRKAFVTPEAIADVLAAAPDAEWKCIVALARYGGLRTPSETFALRWQDIDWERGTIRVVCPKLAHRDRFAEQIIPMFPELRGALLDLWDETPTGTEYVIVRNRLGSANLRTRFCKIIRRAGRTPRPRLFHNLRASRQTELMRTYDLATVCRWLGNSPEIAARHYATSVALDADFQRATAVPEAAQNPAHSAHDSPRNTATPDNAEPENPQRTPEKVLVSLGDADCRDCLVGGKGLEPLTFSV